MYAASGWDLHRADSPFQKLDQEQSDERLLLSQVPEEVKKLVVGKDGLQTMNPTAGAVKPDYIERLLSRTLLQFDVEKLPDDETVSLLQAHTKPKYRQKLVKPLLYRDTYQHSGDARMALTRMLQKHVGKTHELSIAHSQADEYMSVVALFANFDDEIHCDLLTEMMKEVFVLYHPGGFTLSDEEHNEVMELYYNWVLENDLDGCELGERIVKSKEGLSDFVIGGDANRVELGRLQADSSSEQ
eukprot:gene43408-53905_t